MVGSRLPPRLNHRAAQVVSPRNRLNRNEFIAMFRLQGHIDLTALPETEDAESPEARR